MYSYTCAKFNISTVATMRHDKFNPQTTHHVMIHSHMTMMTHSDCAIMASLKEYLICNPLVCSRLYSVDYLIISCETHPVDTEYDHFRSTPWFMMEP